MRTIAAVKMTRPPAPPATPKTTGDRASSFSGGKEPENDGVTEDGDGVSKDDDENAEDDGVIALGGDEVVTMPESTDETDLGVMKDGDIALAFAALEIS